MPYAPVRLVVDGGVICAARFREVSAKGLMRLRAMSSPVPRSAMTLRHSTCGTLAQ